MDRRLLAGIGCVLVSGCAMARSGMPLGAKVDPIGEMASLPPIGESINRIDAPGDRAAKRVGLPAIDDELAGTSGDVAPIPSGRRNPFAGRSPGEPRRQSARPDPERSAGDEGRPAPYADQIPSGARPTVSELPSASLPPIDPAVLEGFPTLAAASPEMPTELPAPSSSSPPMPPTVATGDVSVKTASTDATTSASEVPIRGGIGGTVATVGREVITIHEIQAAMIERREKVPPDQWNDPSVKKMIFDDILKTKIDQSLIIQAAKRKIKDPKNLQMIYDSIDAFWTDQELPPLLRTNGVANIQELKAKLTAQGKSLDKIRQDFRLHAFAVEFVMQAIKPKLTASLPEKQKYYTKHLDDFQLPSQVVWDEIEVDIAKAGGREVALQKAEGLLARIRRGDDFATLAKAESQGATAREGGRWQTKPDASAIPEINEALNSLPIGEPSGVIEAPGGFHVVRVASRRDAGAARFDEVQDKVKDRVIQEKQAGLYQDFIEELRAKTVVTTAFDAPGDPSATRTSAEAPVDPQ